jgi:hypothetical protein
MERHQRFTFLEYGFTMPGKLAARKAKFQPPAATAL